jgi:hypothetical protein
VVRVIAEVVVGLFVRAEAAEGRHDVGIPVDLTEMLLAQAFGEKAVGAKGVYNLEPTRAPQSVTTSRPVYPIEEPENRAWVRTTAPHARGLT